MPVRVSIQSLSSSCLTNSAFSSVTFVSPQRYPCAKMAMPSSLTAKYWKNLLSKNQSAVRTTTCTSTSAAAAAVACLERFVPSSPSHPSPLHPHSRSETSLATSIPPSIALARMALTFTKSSSMSTTQRTSRFTPSARTISMQRPANLPS